MGNRRYWTEKEKEYLNKSWGNTSLLHISKKLNRTMVAVYLKAKRMKLGASTKADEYITANQVSEMLKIDRHTVMRWTENKGLKSTRKATLFKKLFLLIKHEDLIKWLEINQDKFDSRRIELYGLGCEPEWLKEKRIVDSKLAKNRFKIWINIEIQRLLLYLSEKMRHKKIAKILGRSCKSVGRKLWRIRSNNISVKVA